MPYGAGWGKVKPRKISNGGVPSGIVTSIKWYRWGKPIAKGRGKTSIYRPSGGYYPRKGKIRLWARKIGKCPGSPKPAYKKLFAQAQVRPGGPYGRKFAWSGLKTICKFEFARAR